MTVVHIVIMGVAGTGKTTVGDALASRFGLPFAEGDDFHSPHNRAKMASGRPLTDEDRWPWLRSLRDWMSQHSEDKGSVVACSALRRAYRDILREAVGDVFFVHLKLPEDVNLSRIANRSGHYMKPAMLDSQLATLEALRPDEAGWEILNLGEQEKVISQIAQHLLTRFPQL